MLHFFEKHSFTILEMCVALLALAAFANSYSIELQRLTNERLNFLSFLDDAQRHSKQYTFLTEHIERAEYMRDVSVYNLALQAAVNKTYIVTFLRTHNDRLNSALDTVFMQMITFVPLLCVCVLALVFFAVRICVEFVRQRGRVNLVREMRELRERR